MEFFLILPFCSTQAFNILGEAHPYWLEQSALLSLLNQMLISSRNILIDRSEEDTWLNIIWRIILNQISRHPVTQSRGHETNHKSTPCQLGTNTHLLKPYLIFNNKTVIPHCIQPETLTPYPEEKVKSLSDVYFS